MPFTIQRVPRGLNDLLSIFGGQTPRELEDRVRGTIELLQMYGLSQRQVVSGSNGALAEGGTVIVTLNATQWSVLFSVAVTIVKTATMTALRGGILLNRSGQVGGVSTPVADEEMGPFGATETGNCSMVFIPPYPLLCPPTSFVAGTPRIIGTDANCNLIVQAEIGVVGP